ncbi:MAG: single-stranded-DNA-specific exonuclease RecJ [Alphaproteobacteria bacterium]|jgi:single-stranded-DNA-specific exonuclease
MNMQTAALGVEHSLTSQCWVLREAEPDLVAAIARQNSLSEIVARLLAVRNVAPDAVDFFLAPRLAAHLPDPCILKDMEKAARRLAAAVEKGEKIGVFGDYDVDGATSTSVLTQFLLRVGAADVLPRIPERDEGYGPTAAAMRDFGRDEVSLIVTVDCGTTSFEALAAAEAEVIVVDHHEPDVTLPPVYAVVNPKRLDEPADNPCRHMAAVGVVFLLIVAINRILRQDGWYSGEREEPDLRRWLDLVALGTVCDVVQLRGVNRLFVKSGLTYLASRANKGLAVLSELSGIKEKPTTYHLGYVLGPRLNACGRIGQASLGMKLLCAGDEGEAREIAARLDELNALRRQMCEEVLKQAIMQIESRVNEEPFVFVSGKDWHAGIIGIIAGRLKDRYKLPSLVMSLEGDDVRGSARSVVGVNIGAAVMAAAEQGILTRGGGHAMAAGFSLKADALPAFKTFLCEYIAAHHEEEVFDNSYVIDGIVDIGAVSSSLVDTLSCMEPFGEGNPEPRFAVANVAVSYVQLRKGGHVSCTLVGRDGRSRMRAIAFRAADSEIGQVLLKSKGELYHMAGLIRPDTWRGPGQVQFVIEDVALA